MILLSFMYMECYSYQFSCIIIHFIPNVTPKTCTKKGVQIFFTHEDTEPLSFSDFTLVEVLKI